MKKILNKIKKYKYILIAVLLLITVIIYISIVLNNRPRLYINNEDLSYSEGKVYIDGAVNNPGTYIVNKGTYLKELIDASGGLKKNSDLESIDLNRYVKVGEKILIAYKKDENYDVNIDSSEIENELDINEKNININNATKEELMTLEGIGEKTAEKIILYREKNEFEEIEDIMKVEGIGNSKFSNIKNRIVVE